MSEQIDVTTHSVRMFCRAVGDEHPAHTDVEAAKALGYRDLLAPPTFLARTCIPLLEEFLHAEQIPLARIVHAQQSFSFTRSVCVGDRLTASFTMLSRKRFGPGEMILTEVRATDGGGVVVTAPMTLLVRGDDASTGSTDTASTESASAPVSVEIADGNAPPAALSEWEKDLTLPRSTTQLTRETLVRYAAASGDFNPIHYSDHAARAIGLDGAIAHGMLTMAHATRTVTDALRDPGMLREVIVSFNAPVPVPDDGDGTQLVCGAAVSAHDAAARTARVTLTGAVDGISVLKRARAALAW